jgi:uncharacterized protein (TIGR02231 family)
VTLLEDRAHVRRRGKVALDAGIHRLQIDAVSPLLSNKSLAVRVDGGSVDVIDSRTIRRAVFDPVSTDDAGDKPSDRARLAGELGDLDMEIERLLSQKMLLESQASGFDQIAGLSFAELAVDVSWGKSIEGHWNSRFESLRAAERNLRRRLVELSGEYDKLARRRERVRARIEALDTAASHEWAAVQIELNANASGEHVIALEYLVPNAAWRPYHTARLITGAKAKVEFSTAGCVWQNTGEDWKDVQISFSTERPSLGVEPPSLMSDVLSTRRKSDKVEVETRDQQIQTTGYGSDATVSPELPGIDDGGETLDLRAKAKATVLSDGRPQRIPLGSFESKADVSLVAMPELIVNVLTRSKQSNEGEGPILAGPVDLIRDSGYVGRSSVLFVAKGETFELGWGPDSELRIKRTTTASEDKSKMLSSWVSRKQRISVRLSNIGSEKRVIEVTERVPVSEIDKVKIEVQSLSPKSGEGPDRDGFIKWSIELAPYAQTKLVLEYALKKHQDVVGI